MPYGHNNALDAIIAFLRIHEERFRHILRVALVILTISVCCETFIFNLNYFTSSGYNTINVSDKTGLAKTVDGEYRITTVNHSIELADLNTKVENVFIEFDASQPAQLVDVDISFTDSAHATYFGTTDYSTGVPTAHVATNGQMSQYINLQTTGYTNDLKITFGGDDVSYPIKIKGIYLNAPRPFEFNWMRFTLLSGFLALLYIFRPRSSIYRTSMVEHQGKVRVSIIATVLVEVVFMSSFLFLGSNLVGVSTSTYNSGSWDKKSIVNTFDVGGDNAQQYANLAKAMAHGQLYLDEEPPDWLKTMSDPYDKGARDELQKQTGQEYLFDVAYRNGHYYVYFGVVPVMVFYLPFYLITGGNFPTAIGVLMAVVAFVVGITALLARFARYHFKRVSLGVYLLLQIPLVFCCGTLYLLKFPTFYSLPIAMAMALTVWGLYLWMRGRAADKPIGWFVAGSLCMALVFGCRPQLGLLSLLAIPLFWRSFITERHLLTADGRRQFIALIAPYVLIALGLMAYNYLRFGSVADFGANYNLTVNDMTQRGWNLGRLAPALFAYFLQTPVTTGVFPFLQEAPFDTTYMGQTIREATFGGILACLPLLWLLPFSRRILQMRFKARSTRTIAGVIIVLLAVGVGIALLDAEAAGILQRYYADFSFEFLAAVVLLVFIVNENLDQSSNWHRLLLQVLVVLVALSVFYSLLLCLVAETNWFSDAYPWAYESILKAFLFWT